MATPTTAVTTTPPGSKAAAAPPPSPPSPPVPPVPDAVQELLQKHSLLWCVQARKAFVVQPRTTPPEAMPSSPSSSSPPTASCGDGGDGGDNEKELDTQMERLLNAVDPHALCCQPWVRASATHSLALLHAGNDRGMSAKMGFEFGVVIKADEKGAGLW